MIALAPTGQVIPRFACGFFQQDAQIVDVMGRVMPPVARCQGRGGAAPFEVQLAQVAVVDAKHGCSLTGGEGAHGFLRIRREQVLALCVQLA